MLIEQVNEIINYSLIKLYVLLQYCCMYVHNITRYRMNNLQIIVCTKKLQNYLCMTTKKLTNK